MSVGGRDGRLVAWMGSARSVRLYDSSADRFSTLARPQGIHGVAAAARLQALVVLMAGPGALVVGRDAGDQLEAPVPVKVHGRSSAGSENDLARLLASPGDADAAQRLISNDRGRALLTYHRLWGRVMPVTSTDTVPEGALPPVPGVDVHLLALGALAELADVLDRALGVPWLVFKGPVLASRYARPDSRTYQDLDILVRPADMLLVIQEMQGRGWQLLDRNWVLLRDRVPAEVHLLSPGGLVVDLHWSMTSVVARGLGMGIAADRLLARAESVDLGGLRVPALAPADALVHVCVHAGMGGADRLGWLVDVAVSLPGTDNGDVAAAAAAFRAEGLVSAVMARTRRVLGVPAESTALGSSSGRLIWSVAAGLSERLAPVWAVQSDGSAASVLPRLAAGRRPRASGLVRALGRPGGRPPRFENGPANPMSMFYRAGDWADVEAFARHAAAVDAGL